MYRAVRDLSRESRRSATVMCASPGRIAARREAEGAAIVPAEKARPLSGYRKWHRIYLPDRITLRDSPVTPF
jgi:hypothetical protein